MEEVSNSVGILLWSFSAFSKQGKMAFSWFDLLLWPWLLFALVFSLVVNCLIGCWLLFFFFLGHGLSAIKVIDVASDSGFPLFLISLFVLVISFDSSCLFRFWANPLLDLEAHLKSCVVSFYDCTILITMIS